jgi:hypothetical protein
MQFGPDSALTCLKFELEAAFHYHIFIIIRKFSPGYKLQLNDNSHHWRRVPGGTERNTSAIRICVLSRLVNVYCT